MNYKVLIDTIYDGFYFTDSDRRIMFWNKSAERITGFIAEEVLGHRCSDNILIHVDGKGNNLCLGMCPLAATIEDGSSRESEVYLHHKNGHRLPVWIRITPIRDTKGVIVGGAELFTDLSPRNALALRIEELERHALLDNLTQLANRYYIERELEGRFSEMQRYGLSFGLLLMDIDHFKRFNDTYGHDIGDLVLKTVARTLSYIGRPFDLFGRWGGEEFIGITRNIDISALTTIGSRCRAMVENTQMETAGLRLNVTVSLGATMARLDDSIKSLIKRADTLLYMAKEKGRNCVMTDQDVGGV
jgi:diguanylate cyclase (GGDEF)-like protein/PAS domain S-box-containing protein